MRGNQRAAATRMLVLLSAIALFAMSVVAASAQGGGGGGRRGGGRMQGGLTLLNMPSVQKELKMTDDQIAKVQAKQQEVRQQMRELRGSGDDPQTAMAKMAEIQHKAVASILDDTQIKRFHQLELQREGASALGHKEVADQLKLTDDQRASIEAIQKQAMSDTRALMEGKDPRAMTDEDRQKMSSIHKTANEKALAVLTDDQKSQWKEMQGEKFEFGHARPANGV